MNQISESLHFPAALSLESSSACEASQTLVLGCKHPFINSFLISTQRLRQCVLVPPTCRWVWAADAPGRVRENAPSGAGSVCVCVSGQRCSTEWENCYAISLRLVWEHNIDLMNCFLLVCNRVYFTVNKGCNQLFIQYWLKVHYVRTGHVSKSYSKQISSRVDANCC